MTSEPTPDNAAARFKSKEPDPGDYVRLDGAELKALLIGAEVRNPRGMPHARQEFFDTNGMRRLFSGYKWLRYRYAFAGDALCVSGPAAGAVGDFIAIEKVPCFKSGKKPAACWSPSRYNQRRERHEAVGFVDVRRIGDDGSTGVR